MSEKITIFVNGQPLEITPGPSKLTVLVHQPGIKVTVPRTMVSPTPALTSFTKIDGNTTLATMRSLNQQQWTHISTGPVFKELFRDAFPEDATTYRNLIPIPEKVEDFGNTADDVLHVSGLIIQIFEATVLRGENVFIDKIETHLHPGTQQHIMTMIHKLNALSGGGEGKGPKVQVAPPADPSSSLVED